MVGCWTQRFLLNAQKYHPQHFLEKTSCQVLPRVTLGAPLAANAARKFTSYARLACVIASSAQVMEIVTAMQRRYQDSDNHISHLQKHYCLKDKKLKRTREQGIISMNQTVSSCVFHRIFCMVLFFWGWFGFVFFSVGPC